MCHLHLLLVKVPDRLEQVVKPLGGLQTDFRGHMHLDGWEKNHISIV